MSMLLDTHQAPNRANSTARQRRAPAYLKAIATIITGKMMARMTIFLSQIETARAPAPARVTGRMSRHLGQDKKVYSAMRFDNGQMDRVWLIPPLGQKTCSLAQVAQLVEQRTENPRVGGSNPPLGTTRSDRLRSKRSLTEIVIFPY